MEYFLKFSREMLISPQGSILFLLAFVCLFVCQQLYTKSYERILMKFSGSVGGGTNNPLNFGSYR